ncbi:NTE family protein RssA [Janthinobacterium sp. HH103]|uniref:Patatin domain-containing protein n=2 Tax=Janthinobacterium TaxID=29580 RepID=A0A3G2EH16_9BURK|nr:MULTISPECIES: patatin-like phospholipase family protein [Janthinobacterium]AYM79224.1 patatin domain-containing protein [Janthinobacterium agaricidamnosum]OEZ77709.1 NTE family protein RssA [Janthinobacterium sp. HH103]OEZ93655.1 NTE family protein RssA [Janthinobacterium sp. HH107]QOU71183.1 Patatin-like phospholipase [Janthinobacterium sp. HH102]
MFSIRAVLAGCVAALCVLPQAGAAADVPAAASSAPALAVSAPAPARPRIALVLSGGGARGLAHIGVLKVLQELHVPIDMVVGTSMGGVVGGAYAAGASVADLEKMARETNWARVVADRPPRDELAFRRREEDLLLPSRIEFGTSRNGISTPPAAASNAALEMALNRLLPAGMRDRPASQLPLPFRSVASDLVNGELVELVDTPLFLSMRASLAVPGVFAPVRVNNRLVVDGGLVRNLPVDMARAMGADIIIAVNVGTPLAPEKELGSAIGVAQQMLQILTEQNVQRSLKELQPQDILVAPDLTGVSFLDFENYARAMRAGEQAAQALAARLAPLALSPEQYAAREQLRLAAPALLDVALPLTRLAVESEGDINPRILQAQSGLVEGQAVSQEDVLKAAARLYGRGDVARVETEVVDAGEQRAVTIKAVEAPWASSRLRVGLEMASDFRDSNTFALKLLHVRSNLNSWGGELRSMVQIGTARNFGVQYWQPLGAGNPWYIAPSFQYTSQAVDLFDKGRRNARVAYSGQGASLVLGRQFGFWGDLQFGVTRSEVKADVSIPADPSYPKERALGTNQFVQFRVDTLDSPGFPTRGVLFDATWTRSATTGTGESGLGRSAITGLKAFGSGNWAGHVYGEWARAQRGEAPLSLGGFLRLSGTQFESVTGRSVALARFVMARRIGSLPSTLGGAVRAGFSLEMGGGFDQSERWKATKFTQASSAFISVDTRFGPVYVASGASKGGESTLYLFLGPVW